MSTHRAHIVLPTEFIAQIDEEVGPRERSAFLVEVAQAELRKRRLIAVLEDALRDPIWKDEDHPEVADGADAWVQKLRAENERRVEEAEA
jgi:hypothetical protein